MEVVENIPPKEEKKGTSIFSCLFETWCQEIVTFIYLFSAHELASTVRYDTKDMQQIWYILDNSWFPLFFVVEILKLPH